MVGRQIEVAFVSRIPSSWRLSGVLFVILMIGTLGILLARSKPEADPARGKNPDEKVLRFDVFTPIGSMDPKPGVGGCANYVFHFLYSYLFIMNEDGHLEPDLATRWSYDKESFTWTIQIRDGAQFHDGSPVTASDVVFSLRTAIETILPSARLLLDRIMAINEQIIVIRLKKDDPVFLEKIWSFEILKQPKPGGFNDSVDPVGSGPFKFEYRTGNTEVGLTANKYYYRGRPAIDRVIFYYQPDKERSWARLLAGETDLALGIEPQDYQIMEHYGDRFYFKTTIDPYLILLLYNTSDIYLNDSRVRMALSFAIDKRYISRVILRGMGVVPPGNMGYYSSFGDQKRKPIPYDPSMSIRLLHEAGWTYDSQGLYLQKGGKPFEFTILIFEDNRLHESIARYVQLCLNDLGIKVHVQPLPFEELIQRYWQRGEFQAVITEFADVQNASKPVLDNLLFMNGEQAGRASFGDPRITAIVDQISLESDPSRRKALLNELNLLIDSLQPATFLVQKLPWTSSPSVSLCHLISPICIISSSFGKSLPSPGRWSPPT